MQNSLNMLLKVYFYKLMEKKKTKITKTKYFFLYKHVRAVNSDIHKLKKIVLNS